MGQRPNRFQPGAARRCTAPKKSGLEDARGWACRLICAALAWRLRGACVALAWRGALRCRRHRSLMPEASELVAGNRAPATPPEPDAPDCAAPWQGCQSTRCPGASSATPRRGGMFLGKPRSGGVADARPPATTSVPCGNNTVRAQRNWVSLLASPARRTCASQHAYVRPCPPKKASAEQHSACRLNFRCVSPGS